MAEQIVYSRITYSDTEPTNPASYDWWIKNTGASYQVYIYVDSAWQSLIGGGVFVAESGADNHFVNTIISDTEPTANIKYGWFWANEVVRELKIYIGEYILLLGW
jgi:hypothetical protein